MLASISTLKISTSFDEFVDELDEEHVDDEYEDKYDNDVLLTVKISTRS